MNRGVLALLAVGLLVLPLAASETGPNRRAPDLESSGQINVLDVAGGSGWIAAATQDVGSNSLGQNANELVWFLWDGVPSVRQAGIADRPDCGTLARPSDNCQTHAVGVAVSRTGTRLVAASSTMPSGNDGARTLVFPATEAGGSVGLPIKLPGEFVDMAMSDNGQTFAVLTNDVSSIGTARTAHLYLYNWPAGTNQGPSELWNAVAEETGQVGRALALSADGLRVAMGADRDVYWFQAASSTPSIDKAAATGNVLSVDISSSSDHWAVVGFASGQVALYSDQHTGIRAALYHTGSPSTPHAAISRDGNFAVFGFGDGNLRYYRVNQDNPRMEFLDAVRPTTSAVNGIAFSDSGDYLATSSGARVTFYHATGGGLVKLWDETLQGAVRDLAMDGAGATIAAAYTQSGNHRIAVFQASHELTAATPSAPVQIQPEQSRNTTVTFTNTGNRPAEVSLSKEFPTGWAMFADPDQFVLQPGQSRAVSTQVIAPTRQAPGTYEMKLEWTLAAGPTGEATYNVEVPVVRNQIINWPGGPSADVAPGQTIPFSFTVVNDGNAADQVQLQAAAARSGWTAVVTPTTFDLASGASRTVTLEITAPSNAASGSSSVVTVTPLGFPQRQLSLTAVVGADYGAQFGGAGGTAVSPGQQAQMDVIVRNTGNAPDAFDLSVTTSGLPAGWSAAFLSGQSTFRIDELAAGQEVNATIIIQAPATAQPGSTVILPVRATSVGDPSQTATRSLILSVEAPPGSTPTDDPESGTPMVGLVTVLALLAVLAAVRRRD